MSSTENQEIAAIHLNQQAEIYLSQGKLDAAHAACLKALSIKPELALACKTLGNILQAKGEIEAAKNCYIQTIKIAPDWAEVHANLGSMYARQEQWESAIKCYQKAISIKPNIAGFYRNLAKIWLGLGKHELVTECSYQALIWEPTSATAKECLNLGDKLLELGKIEEAIACYYRAIELDKKLLEAYNKLGNTLIQQGELDAAITVYSQGIELNPKNPRLHYNLGKALTKKQLYQQAIIAYSRAIELNYHNHLFHKKLGDVLQKKGLLEEAIACFIQALQIQPNDRDTYYKIAEILAQKNYRNAAVRCRLYQKLPKDLVEKFCKFTGDWEVTSNSASTITRINIYPSSQIDLLPSQTIHKNIYRAFQANQVDSEEAFVAILTDGRAWGDNFNSAIITSDNKLVSDISSGVPELIISSPRLPPVVPIDGTVAFLSLKWGQTNYFHWMFDVIIRIDLLRRSNLSIDKFVFSRCDLPFQRETIEALGIFPNQIIESRFYPHIKAENLLVPSLSNSQGKNFRFPQWGCVFLRGLFLPIETKEKSFSNLERIYISRKKASSRRIVNEQQVVNLLEKFGFKSITLESMSVVQQALLLANTKVIVATHGAGLTNLVFCNPGTKVIEIFHREYILNYYWLLSNVCGLEHYYLLGEPLDEKYPREPAHKNIFVNLYKLLDLMKLAKII